MDYRKVYNDLISKGKLRGLDKRKLSYYTECHHIIPKCMEGSNEDSNLVLLTSREHVIAHVLLSKMYPDNLKIIQSTSAILMKGNKRLGKVSLSFIIRIRENYAKHARELSKRQLGKEISSDIRKKISIANKGNLVSDDTKNKLKESRQMFKIKNIETGEIYDGIMDAVNKLGISRHQVRKQIKTEGSNLEIISKVRETFSYKVEGPDGTIYKSIKDCARTLNKCDKTIKNWIDNYPELGYKLVKSI